MAPCVFCPYVRGAIRNQVGRGLSALQQRFVLTHVCSTPYEGAIAGIFALICEKLALLSSVPLHALDFNAPALPHSSTTSAPPLLLLQSRFMRREEDHAPAGAVHCALHCKTPGSKLFFSLHCAQWRAGHSNSLVKGQAESVRSGNSGQENFEIKLSIYK